MKKIDPNWLRLFIGLGVLILAGGTLWNGALLMEQGAGDVQQMGITNFDELQIGQGLESDVRFLFDGNAQDFYVALDDSADDLLIGLGSTVGTTPAIGVDENLAVTTYGDLTFGGTTPVLTVGDAGEEDAAIVFDGNAQDYYVALDDSADDIIIGLGSTVGTTPGLGIDENLAVTTYGDFTMGGTTPVLTIGDAGAEDAAVVFDGNAQDFYVGLDDTADDLVIGVGSALGTTQAIGVDESANTDVAGTLQYGANNLYPVGFASSGQQAVYGSSVVTGTLAAPHGLTTVTFCVATMGEDPTSGAGDGAMVTVVVAANVCTLKVWQDDFVTAATETDVDVLWLVIGAP
jgi:hypothetical protein